MSASPKLHNYQVSMDWTGNKQGTTSSYTSYSREYTIKANGKADLIGSSDPAFRGDPKLYNPEELLVASISACHMLWYLHLCAVNKIHVLNYQDNIKGTMTEDKTGGRFTEVTLQPVIVIEKGHNKDLALKLHDEAHKQCFIANSINFPIKVEPTISD